VTSLHLRTPVAPTLAGNHDARRPRVAALYEQAKRAQWNASTDLDWSVEVPFGAPLPDDSPFGIAAFERSPFACGGRTAWDAFRWEFHAWLASQFAHGEQGAVVAAARLTETLPDVEGKLFAASQVADEARHAEAFSRYVREKLPAAYPIAPALAALLQDLFEDPRWDLTALGLQIILEGLATAALRLARSTFHDELIREITRLAARDEARHVAFGILSLREVVPTLTKVELREREDLILTAAELMRRWFLLDDVWERVGVARDDGVAFAAQNELMVAYRQAVFAKAASSLGHVGLMTSRVRDGLERLDLLRPPPAHVS